MNDVNVLMSTYNGKDYLKQQIDSILAQKDCHITLLVRDDGSKDGTQDILNEYASRNQLKWFQGKNIKPARSFMELVCKAKKADFYAFADQDDYWMPEKLCEACSKLGKTDRPAIYFSQTQLADKELNKIESPTLSPLLTQGESLVYAFVSGCTIVFNDSLRQILENNIPKQMPMLHDYWCYIVAQAIGAKVIFDKTPHILYRQHGNNAVGLDENKLKEWKERLYRIFIRRKPERSNNAKILLSTFGNDMTKEAKENTTLLVKAKDNFKERIHLIFDSNFKCGNKKTWLLFKLAVLLNTY